MNGIGNGSLVEGSEQWYAAHKKVSDFDNQLRALNMGKMGQLDGERAVSAEEQAAAEKEEDRLQEDIAYNETLTAKLPADESLTETERREIDEQITADIAYNDAMHASQFDTQLDAEKQEEKDAAITQFDTQMAEEIAVASDLRTDAYNRGYGYFDLEYKDKNRQAFEGQIRFALGIDASGFTKDELREAFAQSTWVLDDAYDISIDEFVEDITTKYDGIKEEALGKIDDKYFALERIGELEENPEFSFVDWYSEDFDMNVRMRSYAREKIELSESIRIKKAALMDGSLSGKEWDETNKQMVAEQARLSELQTLIKDTNIALYGNMEDMNLSQLTIRAEYEFQNLFRELENGLINDSLNWFDNAVEDWLDGDDSAMRNIVLQVYGGEKHLEEIEDFNELRSSYVQYGWESGQWDEQLASEYEKTFLYIKKEMEPYFNEAANFEKTDNGCKFELSLNLVRHAAEYAEYMEHGEGREAKQLDITAKAVGVMFSLIMIPAAPAIATALGVSATAVGVGGVVVGLGASEAIGQTAQQKKEEAKMWNDIALALTQHADTDSILIVEINEETGKPTITEKGE